MSTAITSALKLSSMAESYLLSCPSIFTSKTLHPFVPIPFKPFKLHLSCTHSSSLFSSPQSVKQKSHFPSIIPFVVQTSDSVQQVQENHNWETLESDESLEPFVELNEEAKVFVANLPYDIDSEKLAMLFQKAGIVEISEVFYNRVTDKSRGFGFVTMSTVDEAEKAVEMFHQYDVGGRLLTVNKAAPIGSQPERIPRVLDPAFRIYAGNLPWTVDSTRFSLNMERRWRLN